MEFTEHVGIAYLGMVEDAFVLELALDDRHMSPANRAHGGVLFTLLDTAMGRAVIEALPEGQGCATVELKINYFRPVQKGRIRAEARLVEKTRRIAYAEGSIQNEEGKLLARASGTFFITESRIQADRERV